MEIQVGKKYASKAFGKIVTVKAMTEFYLTFSGEHDDIEGLVDTKMKKTTFEQKFDELVEHSDLDVLSKDAVPGKSTDEITTELVGNGPEVCPNYKSVFPDIQGTATGRISSQTPAFSECNTPKSGEFRISQMDLEDQSFTDKVDLDGEQTVWDSEPNVVRFRYNGLKCLIMRHPEMRMLCGYIRLPEGSIKRKVRNYGQVLRKPIKGAMFSILRKARRAKGYAAVEMDFDVHGGITFSGRPWHYMAGNSKTALWVGFDCAHFGDVVPAMLRSTLYDESVYRDISYVTQQLKHLADQIIKQNKK